MGSYFLVFTTLSSKLMWMPYLNVCICLYSETPSVVQELVYAREDIEYEKKYCIGQVLVKYRLYQSGIGGIGRYRL